MQAQNANEIKNFLAIMGVPGDEAGFVTVEEDGVRYKFTQEEYDTLYPNGHE